MNEKECKTPLITVAYRRVAIISRVGPQNKCRTTTSTNIQQAAGDKPQPEVYHATLPTWKTLFDIECLPLDNSDGRYIV